MIDISEAASKKRRGRPRLDPPDVEAMTRALNSDITTRRGRQARRYAAIAQAALTTDDGTQLRDPVYTHILGLAPPFRYSTTVLEELGRLGDEDTMRELANVVCTAKLSCKAAVQRIRDWRLRGETRCGTASGLTAELAGAIDRYRGRFPRTTDETVEAALERLLAILRRRPQD